jgi:hypothetical protein
MSPREYTTGFRINHHATSEPGEASDVGEARGVLDKLPRPG